MAPTLFKSTMECNHHSTLYLQTPRDAEQLGWPVRFSSDSQPDLRRQSLGLGPQAQARVIAAGVRKTVEVRGLRGFWVYG